MRTKKCKKCGKLFEIEKSEAYLCPDCATMARKTGAYRERVCMDCGATFCGFPKSKRCPDCQRAVNLARKRDYNKRGPVRGLGSVDSCEICGAEYVVESGRQRYCKDCAADAVRDEVRRAKREYNASRPEIIGKAREARKGCKVCPICGGAVPAGTVSVTCSPECAAEQLRRNRARADAKRSPRKR